MKYNESGAFILSETKSGERIVSCGGRISTREGSAVMLYKKATDKQKNLNLVNKVVASGHKTVLEHHNFNLAFNNVSIFVEQYLIEFRLASFTIKSGRYVNFQNAGFNLPDGFTTIQQKKIKSHYKKMFNLYKEFVDQNIPVEDARFVLPYGLKTNIYMTLNAREFVHLVCSMIYGRGNKYEEIFKLGNQLKAQFELRYPGLIECSKKDYSNEDGEIVDPTLTKFENIELVDQSVSLLSYPQNALESLNDFAKFSGYKKFDFLSALKNDKHAKLLEHFNYTFKVSNFALIILKHYTRHRMQSLSCAPIVKLCDTNKYVIPPSIEENKVLKEKFILALNENQKLRNSLIDENINPYLMIYLLPHATKIDFVSTMNARELLHFSNLRCCNRAQWTIRNLATSMLKELKEVDPNMFKNFGPTCYTFGACPEGRLCCGKMNEMKEKFDCLGEK